MAGERSLSSRDALDATLERVLTRIGGGPSKVLVLAEAGSGRRALARRLASEVPGAVGVSLLDFDEPEAAVHATALLDAQLGRGPEPLDPGETAEAAAREAATVIVRVPDSWRLEGEANVDSGVHGAGEARRLFDALWHHGGFSTVVIAAPWLGLEAAGRPERLGKPSARVELLFEPTVWGRCAAAAKELGAALSETPGLMPVPLRLAVGARYLGVDLPEVLEGVRRPAAEAIPLLTRRLCEASSGARKRALARCALLRRPLERAQFLEALECDADDADFFSRCLGYGAPVEVPDQVRTTLRARGLDADPQAHAHAGDTWKAKDGAGAPPWRAPAKLEAWFEKAHHYGLALDARAAEWNALQLPARELYWSRGRALSTARQYEEAASIYRRCLERYPDDDYAAHYLGSNLAWAGRVDDEPERHLRRAIELSSENVWWNARLVTHLILSARPDAAEAAWREALARVDPSGTRTQQDPWLARHLHRWVAEAWWKVGRPDLAAEVLDALPKATIEKQEVLSELSHATADALEAERLGYGVYAYGVPIDERWAPEPRHLDPFIEDGVDLDSWFPGQVIEVVDGEVHVAYADPLLPPEDRHLAVHQMALSEWRRLSAGLFARPGLFVELGVYTNGERRVAQQVERKLPFHLRLSDEDGASLRA